MLTQSQFIKNYITKSKISEEKYNELGHFAMPCDCGVDGCEGWAMIGRDSILTHIELYMNKDNFNKKIRFRNNLVICNT